MDSVQIGQKSYEMPPRDGNAILTAISSRLGKAQILCTVDAWPVINY
jgi:hypothetical protein